MGPEAPWRVFVGFCADVDLGQVSKYLVHLPPAQPSAVSVENYSVAMSLVLAAEESVSTAPRDMFALITIYFALN